MSAHVPPHRWADAWAGRVDAREHAAMNRHADRCRECAQVRTRIRSASDSFTAIRAQSSPELPWDTVRARVHWSVSSERRARRRAQRASSGHRWLPRIALGAFASGAVAVAIVTGPVRFDAPAAPPSEPVVAIAPAPVRPTAEPTAATAALVGLVNRATGEVMLDGIRRADDLFARELGPGTEIATRDGRVDVQFADASAFALGPGSRLVLRRFDAGAVELVLDVGTVDIEVAPRAANQRFTVIAGERTIEVRGTRFRVRHDATATSVACGHGLVAVRDRTGVVEVAAAHRLELTPRTVGAVQALSADELGALEGAKPLLLRLGSLDTLRRSSAPLEIVAAGRREIRVDDIELGRTPMRIRVMPGRHIVETADAAGRFRRAGSVEVAAPSNDPGGASPARFEVPAEPPPTRDISERRRKLRTGIDHAKLRQCTRQISKQGLTGTYVQIEIAVDAAGAVNFLNVLHTDLGKATASCVRNVLLDVRFGAGGSATWSERIDL